MKVLHKPKKEAWVGRRVKCSPGCGAVLKLEAGDKVTYGSDRDGSYLNVTCPECGKVIFIGI